MNETTEADTSDGRPSPPPGEGWARYKDDENIWWYYDGPRGKWWCVDGDKTNISKYPEEGFEGASSDMNWE